MAELQILKSVSQHRQERQEMEMQMFLARKNQSRKPLLQTMDEELDMVEALGLCAPAMKRPRKERVADEERSSSWGRNGYRNEANTAFKQRCNSFLVR